MFLILWNLNVFGGSHCRIGDMHQIDIPIENRHAEKRKKKKRRTESENPEYKTNKMTAAAHINKTKIVFCFLTSK